MNKPIISLITVLIAILSVSCDQKEELQTESLEYENSIIYALDNVPIIPYNKNVVKANTVVEIQKLMENPDDANDEKINTYLYELSLATKDLIKDPAFNNIIISLAQRSVTHSANLLDLEVTAPQFFNAINANLATKRLSLQIIADDLTYAPVAPNPDYPETSEIEQYVPAIFIPNLDRIDSNLQPIISPNIGVDSRFDESIEDNIIVWYFKNESSNDVEEIMLSEATSLTTSNPLFLVDNALTTLHIEPKKDAEPMFSKDQESATSTYGGSGTLSFSSYEHSIQSQSYRYESFWGGKSEFAVNGYRIDPSGTAHWIYNNTSDNSKVINRIKKNQIGSTRYKWSYHAANWQPWSNPWTPHVTQYGVNMVFWNTYERDWNRSPKGLGTCWANGTTIYLSGRRKYSSEWYAWIPSTTKIHYTRFQWVYDNWAHWNNSWKSKFRLWRVHI